jgi:predicted transcriptional regulator
MREHSTATGSVPTDKPRVTVYLDEDVKTDLEKLAEAYDRPVSNYVLRLIKQAIADGREKGLIK